MMCMQIPIISADFMCLRSLNLVTLMANTFRQFLISLSNDLERPVRKVKIIYAKFVRKKIQTFGLNVVAFKSKQCIKLNLGVIDILRILRI